MCTDELVLFISTLAITISKDRSADEVEELGVIFTQLGDTLLTIAVGKSRQEARAQKELDKDLNC